MKGCAFGVDIGGTSVKFGLFDGQGRLLDKWEIPTDKTDGGAHVLPDVAKGIRGKMNDRGIAPENVAGVGVGVPGAVAEDGMMPGGAVNIGWGSFNLVEELRNCLKLPVKAANDANAAAYGEMWQGGGRGCSNLVAVTLGTGVGGGIIVNGRLLTGATGAGGEIGHIHVEDQETKPCNCGNRGCLEQYASATGIVRLAERRLTRDGKESLLRSRRVTAKAVFDALKEGDAVAGEIALEFGEYLGKGLAIVAGVVNPELFVIGGGVSKAGDILFRYIEPPFRKYAFAPCRGTGFALAKLGNDAGIYGAAGLILHMGS